MFGGSSSAWPQWQLLKIKTDSTKSGFMYKVFCTEYSEAWQMNSGIASYKEFENHIEFYGFSGSRYVCYKGGEGKTRWYNVLNEILGMRGVEKISYEDFVKEFVPEVTE